MAGKRNRNITRPNQISMSLNLIRAAQLELQFLYFVNRHPALYDGPVVQRAIQRYELLWLPLAANCTEKILAPPADVHWVWFVHMLAPEYYAKDCKNVVGSLVDHKLFKMKALKKAHKRTRKLWVEMYPDEPFDVVLDGSQPIALKEYTSLLSYDLQEAVRRQSMFYYQVSLPHYMTKGFLKDAVERYKKLLYLKSQYPKQFLVPCYDMDIIWHAHMVHPKKYIKDTQRVLGKTLNHDDSVNDRAPGSKLSSSDSVTRELWVKTFGVSFSRNGAMFRGEPPDRLISPVPQSMRTAALGCTFHLQVKKVVIGGAPPGGLKIKLFHQVIKPSVRSVEKERLGKITLFKDLGYEISEHNIEELGLEFSLPDKLVKDQFVLEMVSQREGLKSMLASGFQSFECSGHFDFTELLKLKEENATIIKTFLDRDTRVELTFAVRVSKAMHYSTLGVLTGPFTTTKLDPSTVRRLYGIVPRVCEGTDEDSVYKAEMATHRIVNETCAHKPQVLEVEVYHSRPLLHSAVHLYADSNGERSLVALAQTVDINTLPTPQDLSVTNDSGHNYRNFCLNQKDGERAMVIKTNAGDWALVVAKWAGLMPGVPSVSPRNESDRLALSHGSLGGSTGLDGLPNGYEDGFGGGTSNSKSCSPVDASVRSDSMRGRPGSPGHLVLYIHQLHQFQYRTIALPYERREYTFCLGGVTLDLERGVIEVSAGNHALVENISLALTASVLHVLCQPRPDRPAQGQLNRIPVEKLALLHALGYYVDSTPHNTFLKSYSGEGCGGCGSCGGCGGCGGCGACAGCGAACGGCGGCGA